MPSDKKITKKMIVNAGFEIFRKKGFDAVTARGIAKEINCSTQPIYLEFRNMDDLKTELVEKIAVLQKEMFDELLLTRNGDMFFRRKSVIVSELNLAVEIFAAAFCIKMNDLEMLLKFSNIHVMVRMVLAVLAKARRIAKTAQNMMVFGAIVEIYVPTYRNEEHQKRHQ